MNAMSLVAILLFLVSANAMPGGVETSEEPANDFARKILVNEITAENQDHSHWMCRVETDTSHGKQIDEVVETKDGDLKRHVVVNGKELGPMQQRAEDKRIQKLANNPAALRKAMKNENADSNQSQKMLRLLPDALTFSYGERHGDTVELHFTSNPRFRPPSHEAQVFQALEGNLWVNSKDERLVEFTGHLRREVRFGYGLLGYLRAGGRFEVKQAEVAPGYWELTLLDVNMRGKALFFKTISVQQNVRRTNFRTVPNDLSVSKAAELLRQQPAGAESTGR